MFKVLDKLLFCFKDEIFERVCVDIDRQTAVSAESKQSRRVPKCVFDFPKRRLIFPKWMLANRNTRSSCRKDDSFRRSDCSAPQRRRTAFRLATLRMAHSSVVMVVCFWRRTMPAHRTTLLRIKEVPRFKLIFNIVHRQVSGLPFSKRCP